MKRLIMCTAGHVDHGKTALVRTLTGIDCDTHPEERARGITINPGFASLDLVPDEPGAPGAESATLPLRIGIVDVPGHQRFIHNMLAGACGVDFALLVVAADDGVMPQTREHLAILQCLGVQSGLIALTKVDLAGPDIVAIARDEIREATAKSFLDSAEIVPFSSLAGIGIQELKAAIARVVRCVPERPVGTGFRMYIDRVFPVAGFGTVVTGSVLGGQAHTGDALFLLPQGIEVRVRRMERHGAVVEAVRVGERASLNITGLRREEFVRGMLLSDQMLRSSARIDAELRFTDPSVAIVRQSQALFYVGTHESLCRIQLLGVDSAGYGQSAIAQLELARPAPLMVGDRFILRSTDGMRTMGGGSVIDADPLHHRRRHGGQVDLVRRRAEGGLPDQIAAEVQKHIGFVPIDALALALNRRWEEIAAAVEEPGRIGGEIQVLAMEEGPVLLSPLARQRLWHQVRRAIIEHQHRLPLDERGMDASRIAARVDACRTERGSARIDAYLQSLVAEGHLSRGMGGYRTPDFSPRPTAAQRDALGYLRERFRSSGMNVVPMSELEETLKQRWGLPEKELRMLLRHLVEHDELVAIDDVVVWKEIVERCRTRLLGHLQQTALGMTVAGFRDLVSGNRRICLLLMGLYDREGFTRREGDLRFITDQGRAWLFQQRAAEASV